MDLFKAPMSRLRLTLHCQCCDRRFQRSMDLSLHLQTAHAALWYASQETLGVLVGAFYSKCGCVCNPSTTVQRAQHVCVPFKQLSMQFHRQSDVPLFPITLTDGDIATLLAPRLSRSQRFKLEQVLTERRFEATHTHTQTQAPLPPRVGRPSVSSAETARFCFRSAVGFCAIASPRRGHLQTRLSAQRSLLFERCPV